LSGESKDGGFSDVLSFVRRLEKGRNKEGEDVKEGRQGRKPVKE
jgi:hypothetical protein